MQHSRGSPVWSLVECRQESGGVPLGRRGKLALQREAAAAEAAAEARTRSKREREADAARGPPPDPLRSFRLPQPLLPDLLTVWELLQMLAPVLQAGTLQRSLVQIDFVTRLSSVHCEMTP